MRDPPALTPSDQQQWKRRQEFRSPSQFFVYALLEASDPGNPMMRKLILVTLLMLTPAQTRNGTIEVTVRDVNTRQPIPAVQATLTFDPLNAPDIS
ncbi:MAG TPA: hypothetical protein VFR18_11695, partial [Terriglobia bacterium]|nr:hypothetical protein [Terriglobia bacterium]